MARARDRAVLTVADEGPGVEPALRPRVFDPYYTTKGEGTGLGLAIVRQAAEAHGGTVVVESQPGRGATFRIRLPAAGPGQGGGPEEES